MQQQTLVLVTFTSKYKMKNKNQSTYGKLIRTRAIYTHFRDNSTAAEIYTAQIDRLGHQRQGHYLFQN